MVFRFEYYENMVTKHKMKKITWQQAASWAFNNNLGKANYSVASVKMLDDHTVEVIKRRDQNKSIFFKWGYDQTGLYERIIINRKD